MICRVGNADVGPGERRVLGEQCGGRALLRGCPDGLWTARVDPRLFAAVQSKRERRYDGASIFDLLRFVRNCSAEHGHFRELPAELRAWVDSPGVGGMASYVLRAFPALCLVAARFEGTVLAR